MKVLIVSREFPPKISGGGTISAYNLANALANKGVEVHVMTSKDVEVSATKIEVHPVIDVVNMPYPMSYFEYPFYWKTFEAVSNFLREVKIDVIHAMNMNSIPGAILAANRHKIPSVITVNSYWLVCPKGTMIKPNNVVCDGKCDFTRTIACFSDTKFYGRMFGPLFFSFEMRLRRKIASYTDAFVSVSKAVERYVRQLVKPKKSYVIPNIVNVEEYRVTPMEECRSDILFAGRLERNKGCEYLIRAMPFIVKEHKDAILRVVGSGSELSNLLKLTEKLDIKRNVIFSVFMNSERIKVYYASTKVVVVPSIAGDPLPRVPLEAMAMRKPVVATNVGGIPEIVENGKTGFLVSPKNPKEIADKVNILLSDKRMREKMGFHGFKKVMSEYSPSAVSEKYLAVYNLITSRREDR